MLRRTVSLITSLILLFSFALPASAANGDSAKASVVVDFDDLSLLYENNSDLRLPMASTTKIMTAIVAIENGNLEKSFTVSDEAVGIEGSSLYIKSGESFTLKELLYALLLQSANDAAVAIACEVSGSLEGFADLMNEKAAELKLCNTHFENPNGLDGESHYTSAFDLAVITAYALKNPLFSEICSSYKYALGERTLVNHNRLLTELDGCIGVKTGYTKNAGRCLVSAVKRNNKTLICVTLNDGNDWADHKSLYDACFKLYEEKTVCRDGGLTFYIPEKDIKVKSEGNITLYIKKGEDFNVTLEINRFPLSSKNKNLFAGYAVFTSGNTIIKKAELFVY